MQLFQNVSESDAVAPSQANCSNRLSPSRLRVLALLLERTERVDLGVNLSALRARGPRLLATLKWLEQREYLRKAAIGHVVSLLVLPRLGSTKAVAILTAARMIYQVLREHYRNYQTAPLALSVIAERVKMEQKQAADILCYMLHASWSSGQTISLHEAESTVNVGEDTVSFRSFDELIAREEGWRVERASSPWAGVTVATAGMRTGVAPPTAKNKSDTDEAEHSVLHARIETVVRPLLINGHHALAIQQACIVLEQMVQEKAGRTDLSGAPLMRAVFSASAPTLRFEPLSTDPRGGEQEGMLQLYAGVMLALRNPRAHAIVEDPLDRTLEILGFVSFLCHSLERVIHGPSAADMQGRCEIPASTNGADTCNQA